MVCDRLQAFVRRRFGPDEVDTILGLLVHAVPAEPGGSPEGDERVQAAVILLSDGDTQRFLEALTMAQTDWRDVLVAAQLADDDWPDRLNAALA